MRVLFSTTPGDGHVLPVLPLARALVGAGHEVAFATAQEYRPRIEAEGFTPFSVGLSAAELDRQYAPRQAALQLDTVPVPDRRQLVFTARFATLEAPARLDDLRAVADEWRPDAVVHESCELAAPIVAAARGIPSYHHSFGLRIPLHVLRYAFEHAAPLWERTGLEPDALLGAYRGTYLDVCPPALQSEGPPPGAIVQPLRVASGRRGDHEGPPLVYATLGTMAPFSRLDRFRDLLDAFAPLDCEVVVTVGAHLDPGALEPVPANARVLGYVPQADILPRAKAVVTHGGSGSTLGALAHGCPMLLLPQGADQFENAAACAAAGAAIALFPGDQTPERLRAALADLLTEPRYAARAHAIASEIAAVPSAAEVAASLFAD
jgi:UDP:flavonoid glycosyltransferase YjiC (YdhE family)